jgi:hypothetical protein
VFDRPAHQEGFGAVTIKLFGRDRTKVCVVTLWSLAVGIASADSPPVEPDGTIDVPGFRLPQSSFLNAETRAALKDPQRMDEAFRKIAEACPPLMNAEAVNRAAVRQCQADVCYKTPAYESLRDRYDVTVTASLLTTPSSASDDLTQPLKVSADGHFLTQPNGQPFFWLADTAWELFTRLTREEVDLYLRDRARKGFNVIQAVAAVGPLSMGNRRTPNRYGEIPFIAGDIGRPNTRYFDHAGWVIEKARSHGIRTALLPFFSYWEVSSKPGELSIEQAQAYGRFLGARFRGRGVIWILGGDTNPIWPEARAKESAPLYPSPIVLADHRPLYDALADGIAEGEGGAPFISYHPTNFSFLGAPDPRTSLYFADRKWLDMNMIQSGHFLDDREHVATFNGRSGWYAPRNYGPIGDEYASTPTRPVIDGEPRFEDLAIDLRKDAAKGYWSGYEARNAAYHAVFAGAAGHTYGNHSIWQFYDDKIERPYQLPPRLGWRKALNAPGAQHLHHLQALMLSRPYFSRIPDRSLIVSNPGDGAAHIGATRDREGGYAMIYLPQGQPVTIDMSKLAGSSAVGWWYDPRTGEATRIAEAIPTNATRRFAPPSQGAEADWVLILDDASKNFSAGLKAPGGNGTR